MHGVDSVGVADGVIETAAAGWEVVPDASMEVLVEKQPVTASANERGTRAARSIRVVPLVVHMNVLSAGVGDFVAAWGVR